MNKRELAKAVAVHADVARERSQVRAGIRELDAQRDVVEYRLLATHHGDVLEIEQGWRRMRNRHDSITAGAQARRQPAAGSD